MYIYTDTSCYLLVSLKPKPFFVDRVGLHGQVVELFWAWF